MSTYITSDLHLGHENLCRNLRGMTAEYNDALIIENWNKTVNKHDKVFILGDVTMDKPDVIRRIIPQLHGSKTVVLGNHDKPRCVKALIDCGCSVYSSLKVHNILLTHIPVDETQLTRVVGNIHGHIHTGESMREAPHGPYYNVNCELHNYTPILFEKAQEELLKVVESLKNS